jgi:hypothetical protein
MLSQEKNERLTSVGPGTGPVRGGQFTAGLAIRTPATTARARGQLLAGAPLVLVRSVHRRYLPSPHDARTA